MNDQMVVSFRETTISSTVVPAADCPESSHLLTSKTQAKAKGKSN